MQGPFVRSFGPAMEEFLGTMGIVKTGDRGLWRAGQVQVG